MRKRSVLAETLRALLEQKRLTIKELSQRSRVPRSTLQEWANGASPLNLQELKRVSDCLGCSFEYLALGRNDTDPRLEELRREKVFEGLCILRLEKVVLPGTGAKE